MTTHVAIVRPPYDRLILDGRKAIESRFTQVPCPPFGRVTPGDTLYVKRAGGPFVARAEVAQVLMVDQLTPQRIDELVKRYNRWICGEDAYWRSVRHKAAYATLMWLRNVQPTASAPPYRPRHMRAWYVLEDTPRVPPSLCVELSRGCFTRGYLRVAPILDQLGDAEHVKLELRGGPTIEPRVDRQKKLVRWAGFPQWFVQHKLDVGDRVEWTRQRHGWLLTPHRMNAH